MRRSLALVAAILMVGGCANPAPTDGDVQNASDSPLSRDYLALDEAGLGSTCERYPAQPAQPTGLPAGFTPVAATRCQWTVKVFAGEGEWFVRVDQRADGDLSGLMRALAEKPPANTPEACTLQARSPIIITLVDAQGRKAIPVVPTDACDDPLPDSVRAIQALPWTTVAETRTTQVRSELEVTTSCGSGYKPVIAMSTRTGQARPVFASVPEKLQICRYALSAETITVDSHEYRMGVLTTAPVLEGAALAQFLAAADAAPAAGPCSQPQSEFAVLSPPGGGHWIYVETGGCYRMLPDNPDDGLRQLTPEIVALLPA